jgi:hypothetical protein
MAAQFRLCHDGICRETGAKQIAALEAERVMLTAKLEASPVSCAKRSIASRAPILTVVAVTIQASAQPSGVPSQVVEALDAKIALLNKQAPIAINPSQKLTHVSRDGGVILYSIETAIPQEQWTQEMRERPDRETTKAMCDDKDTRLLLDYGFQMRYIITDGSGRDITRFFVSKDKCVASQQ